MGRFSELIAAPVDSSVKSKSKNKTISEQIARDEAKQRAISDNQRRYMKCSNGKCVPSYTEQGKIKRRHYLRTRKINFLCTKKHSRKLNRIFVERGRDKRIKTLEREVHELDLKLNAARGKLYLKENDENFRKIEENLKAQERIEVEIEKARKEIKDIKSQFVRLDRKMEELKKETESEMKFAEHLKKANRQLSIYEDRVQKSRQKEGLASVENKKLRQLLRDMIHDRAYFNSYWEAMVKKLKDRKKFLLDMLEKTSQAFSQDADFMDTLKKLTKRRAKDRESAIENMVRMRRKIDANHIMSAFLGGKGKERIYAPLEEREIRRRNNFKREYDERLNFYQNILKEIKKLTNVEGNLEPQTAFKKSINFLDFIDNKGFQLYNYLNELNSGIEKNKFSLNKSTGRANADVQKRDSTRAFFESQVEELNQKLNHEIDKTLKTKVAREKLDKEVASHFDKLMEIITTLKCDVTPIQSMLGENDKITSRNFHLYLRAMEARLNEVLAFVYCDERRDRDIQADDEWMAVRSLKRDDMPPVTIDEVILSTQCPECGELEDVNRFDDKLVKMFDGERVREAMIAKYDRPELAARMHNLLLCNLPRSGIIASRRYAE